MDPIATLAALAGTSLASTIAGAITTHLLSTRARRAQLVRAAAEGDHLHAQAAEAVATAAAALADELRAELARLTAELAAARAELAAARTEIAYLRDRVETLTRTETP